MITIADADAILILRSLGLWGAIIRLRSVQVVVTGFVAEHELNGIADELRSASEEQRVRIEHIRSKTVEWETWKALRKERNVDKGEAESIAWAVHNAPGGILVSNDEGARKAAFRHRLQALDPLDLLVLLVRNHGLDRTVVEASLGTWEDDRHAAGRPKRFTTVANALLDV